jgi:hypothetical protein
MSSGGWISTSPTAGRQQGVTQGGCWGPAQGGPPAQVLPGLPAEEAGVQLHRGAVGIDVQTLGQPNTRFRGSGGGRGRTAMMAGVLDSCTVQQCSGCRSIQARRCGGAAHKPSRIALHHACTWLRGHTPHARACSPHTWPFLHQLHKRRPPHAVRIRTATPGMPTACARDGCHPNACLQRVAVCVTASTTASPHGAIKAPPGAGGGAAGAPWSVSSWRPARHTPGRPWRQWGRSCWRVTAASAGS